jgi:hypothetical protein
MYFLISKKLPQLPSTWQGAQDFLLSYLYSQIWLYIDKYGPDKWPFKKLHNLYVFLWIIVQKLPK